MADKKNPLEFMKSSFLDWVNNSGSDMGIPRFEDNDAMAIQRMIGGVSPLRDQKMGEKALGTIFEEESKALEQRRITLQEYNQRIDDKLVKFLVELDGLVDDNVLNSLEETALSIKASATAVSQLANSVSPDKLKALMPAIGGSAAAGLNQENREKFTEQITRIGTDPNLSSEKAKEEIGRVLLNLTQAQSLAETPASAAFLTSGRYRELSKDIRSAETGSDVQRDMDRQIGGGIRSAITSLRRADASDKQGSFLNMLTGTSSSQLGIDRSQAQAALVEGIKASKEQIANSRAVIAAAKAELEKIRSTTPKDATERANQSTAIDAQNLIIAQEEQRMGEMASNAREAAANLNKPLQESLNQAGAGIKIAFSAFVAGLSQLGQFLHNSIMQVGKATLNPVVTDLFDSLKLGLDMGIKAGQLIYTMTKGTLDSMSNVFGMGGVLTSLLGRGVGSLATQGGTAGQVGGWLQKAGNAIGSVVKGAGIAGIGYLASEVVGGGIRLLGGNRQNEDGTFTKEGKKNEMWASTLQGAGQVASIGAGIGSFFGVPGMAIGGAIGALVGGVSGYIKGTSVVNDDNARKAEQQRKESESREKRIGALQAGAMLIPGLDPSSVSTGNVFEKLSSALPNLAGNLEKIGLAGAGGGLLSIAAGKTGVGAIGRNLMAALTGAGGGIAVGMATATIDFFLKQLNRGAEGMMKFADISNTISVGLNYQMRVRGDILSGGKGQLGERGKITEADFSTYVYDFMTNRGLGNLGYKTEDVAKMFSAASQSSLMGLGDIESAVNSAVIMSRQLGVSADTLLKAYGDADKSFGIGQGQDVLNRLIYGAAPTARTGEPNAVSLEIAQALMSAGRQLQMSGPQTLSSGAKFTDFYGGLYNALKDSGSDYGDFIAQNPQALTTITDSVNNLFKSGIVGGNQLGLSLSTAAGLSAKEALEFGVTSDANLFEAGIGAIMSAIPSTFFEGGKVTDQALNDYLPYLLPGMGLQGSVEGYAEIFELAMSGNISAAQKKLEGMKPEDPQLKALEKLDTTIGGGINKLVNEQNRAEQATLQLMENNIKELVDLSRTASDVGNSLLQVSNQFMGPAISMLTSSVSWLGTGLDKLQEMLGNDKASTEIGLTSFLSRQTGVFDKEGAISSNKIELSKIDWSKWFEQEALPGKAAAFVYGNTYLSQLSNDKERRDYTNALISDIDSKAEFDSIFARYQKGLNTLKDVDVNKFTNPASISNQTFSNLGLNLFGLQQGDPKYNEQQEAVKKFFTEKLRGGVTGLEWFLTNKEDTLEDKDKKGFYNALDSSLLQLKNLGIDVEGLLVSESLTDVYGRTSAGYETALATVMGGGTTNNPLLDALKTGESILIAVPSGADIFNLNTVNGWVKEQLAANRQGTENKP